MVPKAKLRRLKSRSWIRGSLRTSSTTMNALSATAETRLSLTMNAEPNQSSTLPSSSTVWNAARPMAINMIPVQSPCRSRFICGFDCGRA